MPFRFVYFDLDDTLLNHRAAQNAALAALFGDYASRFANHDLSEVQRVYATANRRLWQAYGDGQITRHDLQFERFAALIDAFSLREVDPLDMGAQYMRRYAEAWHWMDGAEAAFLRVADRYPVGILTNGFAEAQHAKLDRFPILRDRSSTIVISEEVGVMKPQPDIFAHATQVAGVRADAILYVGDSLHSDVAGGTAFGWHVAWFQGDAAHVQGHPRTTVIADWHALHALL